MKLLIVLTFGDTQEVVRAVEDISVNLDARVFVPELGGSYLSSFTIESTPLRGTRDVREHFR